MSAKHLFNQNNSFNCKFKEKCYPQQCINIWSTYILLFLTHVFKSVDASGIKNRILTVNKGKKNARFKF